MKKTNHNFTAIYAAVKKIRDIRKEYIRVLFIQAFLQAAQPFIPIIVSAQILDELLTTQDITRLITLVALLIGLSLITHLLLSYFGKRYDVERTHLAAMYYFELSKKSMKLEYSLIEKSETKDLIQLIEEGGNNYLSLWNTAEYLQKGLLAALEIIIAAVLIITAFASGATGAISNDLAFIQSPITFAVLALLLAAGVAVYGIVQGKIGKTAADMAKNGVGANRIFGYLFFWISYNYENGKDIRLYNAQDMLSAEVDKFADSNCDNQRKGFVKPNIQCMSVLNLTNVIMLTAVYTFIILKAYIGAITVGTIFIQINAIMRLYQASGSLLQQYNMLKASCEHFKHSIKFFNMPEMSKSGQKPLDVKKDGHYVFEFKDVSFKYPGSEEMVLKNINIKIETGSHFAVVGMNGAGKTTMIKLLCRLYAPTEGVITLNGVDINAYNFDDYINMFSVVFQDFKLFSFGLGQNISVSEDNDKGKLEQAMKNSGLENMAEELNGDYSVPVGKNFDEDGRDFSGGEQQKISIARALYKDAPIMILDEPTAALDPIAEFEIYSKFNSTVKQKGVIFISHRLSSCRFCHNIIVFDKGSVVQLGSHENLLKQKDGKYAELWNAQAKHYVMNNVKE